MESYIEISGIEMGLSCLKLVTSSWYGQSDPVSIKVLLMFFGNLWKIKENEQPLEVRAGKP